jgi:hypothetical protein
LFNLDQYIIPKRILSLQKVIFVVYLLLNVNTTQHDRPAMTPRRQSVSANFLMGGGILPLALYIAWVATFLITTVPGQPPRVPIIDPIGMVGLGMVVYLGSFIVAGLGIVWSWLLARAYPERRTRRALVLPVIVILVLVLPFVFP